MKEAMKEVQKPTYSNSKYKSRYEFELLSNAHEKKLQTDEPKEKEQKHSEEKIIPGCENSDTMTVKEYTRHGGRLHLKST